MFVKGGRQLIRPFARSPVSSFFPERPFQESLLPSSTCNTQFARRLAGVGSLPQLTKDRYPHVKRGDFAKLDHNHLGYFKELLGTNRVITDEDECKGFNVDWLKNVRGYSQCVLKPKTTEEVSKILSFCNENRIAVCPQGGNTGLVGGSVPVFDEVVLWTGYMNEILEFNDTSGALVCQAGCILETLETYVEERGYMIPLDLGAKGSCFIGGNVSTNAGGLRLLRYGNLHGAILGLEAVTAEGEVLDCLSTLKKDNTGYHLKHLFIGSEGTLGVVTKVAIHCPPKPQAVNVAFLGLKSFEDVLKTLRKAKSDLGEILSSCEMIDESSLSIVTRNSKLKSPLEVFPFYMLIETQGSNSDHDEEKMTQFLEDAMKDGLVQDGTTTNEVSKIKAIWALREGIVEATRPEGYIFKYDVSLPTESFYSVVPVMKERMGGLAHIVCGYGHIGDGNIHLQIVVKEFTQEIYKKIEPFVYEYVSKLKGSVSAEHGVGFRKTEHIHYSKSPEAIAMMWEIKNIMDPKGILNPYKVLPRPH